MSKTALFFFIIGLTFNSFAQTDSLGFPNAREKASAFSALYDLQDFFNCYARDTSGVKRKEAALKLIKGGISSTKLTIPNDLESEEHKVLPVLDYAKELGKISNGKFTIKLASFHPYQMGFDKLRRKYFLVVRAEKISSIESIEPGTGDTLVEERAKTLFFYFRFDRMNNVSSNFKIFAVAKPKEQFRLEPLTEEVQWWLKLDSAWKVYIRKSYKMPEFPAQIEIVHLTNRSALTLENQKFFKDLIPLNSFKKLEILNLKNSAAKDLNEISDLKLLKELNIEGTKITSLEGIENLVRLKKLWGGKLGLNSIKPLKRLKLMEELYLGANDLEDISHLEDMANLKKLDLSLNTKIRNVSVLSKLYALQELSLAKIDIQNLDVLKQMDQLYKLNVFNTGITSLEPLRVLTKLSTLDCSFNVINSLEPIKGMAFMQNLSIAGTAVTDLNTLSNFKFLKKLDCSNNPRLTALGPVVNLNDVEELKCFYTKIDKNEVQQFKRKHVRSKITFY